MKIVNLIALTLILIATNSSAQTLKFCQISNFTSQIIQCFDNMAQCNFANEAFKEGFSCVAIQK